MYEEYIPIEVISEIFENIDIKEPDYREKALNIMDKKKFDVYGLSENGIIKKILNIDGKEKTIEKNEILYDNTPLIDVLYKIRDKKRFLILENGVINKIVTRSDLQKPPVLVVLFGLISILEMFCNELIKFFYPNESWKNEIKKRRLRYPDKIFKGLVKREEEIELLYCLQLTDKLNIVFKKELVSKILNELGYISNGSKKRLKREILELRNSVAHNRFFTKVKSWEIIRTIEIIEEILEKFENII